MKIGKMVPIKYMKRISGKFVKCFYMSKYRAWKVLAIYRAKPHKFKLAI